MEFDVLGVCGEAGCGKDTVADLLKDELGDAASVSMGGLVRAELEKLGIRACRETQRITADYRRRVGGSDYWLRLVLERDWGEIQTLVLCGLYAPDEIRRVHEMGGVSLWIDADEPLRLDRVRRRKDGSRDEALRHDYHKFRAMLNLEYGTDVDCGDAASLGQVRDLCMFKLKNNGSEAELAGKVRAFVSEVRHRFSRSGAGNVRLLSTSRPLSYRVSPEEVECQDKLMELERARYFEGAIVSPSRGTSPDDPGRPLREVVSELRKPNLRGVSGNQSAKRLAGIFSVEDPLVALSKLRKLIPSNQDEEYFTRLSDNAFFDLHLRAHLLWPSSAEEFATSRVETLRTFTRNDKYQFDTTNDKSLARLRETGLVFSVDPTIVPDLKQLATNPICAERPILEIIKNRRVFEVSGFALSKASQVVHDAIDHFWVFDLLDRIGLFQKYQVMFDAVGNPERTDIYKREGEMVASVSFGVRAFANVHPGFRPLVFSKDIVRMVREMRGQLGARHTEAMRIVNNLHSDGTEWKSLSYVFSNYLTELDEQRLTHGRIKYKDPRTKRTSELDPCSPDYLCFLIELHHVLLDGAHGHKDALFTIHYLLEEYLRSVSSNDVDPKQIRVGLDLLDGTGLVHNASIPTKVARWMHDNYGFTATRDPV